MNKFRDEKKDIAIDITKLQRIAQYFHEQYLPANLIDQKK